MFNAATNEPNESIKLPRDLIHPRQGILFRKRDSGVSDERRWFHNVLRVIFVVLGFATFHTLVDSTVSFLAFVTGKLDRVSSQPAKSFAPVPPGAK